MKKNNALYLYGAIIIFIGFFLLFSNQSDFQTIRITLGLTIGAIFSFITAFSRKGKKIEFDYHTLHAIAMIVYGVSVLFFCDRIEILINVTSLLFFFYAFSEVIFCMRLLDLGKKATNNFLKNIVFTRLLLGVLVGIGTTVLMYNNSRSNDLVIGDYGIFFMIIGINILLYMPIIKNKEVTDTLK